MNKRLLFTASLAVSMSLGLAQGPGQWTEVIGPAQGWANMPPNPGDLRDYRSARPIHMMYLRPTSPAMGNTGKLLFFGRNNNGEPGVLPYVWNPFDTGSNPYGTFARTAGLPLDYEAFCCGQTLMMDGKVIIVGSAFVDGFPLKKVSVYNPDTNTWAQSQPQFELKRGRYYPTPTRMPLGEIVVTGGQRTDIEIPEPPPGYYWITDGPVEYNVDRVNALSEWRLDTTEDYNFGNYPHAFPISASELFFPGPSRRGLTSVERYQTFVFRFAHPFDPPQPPSPLGGNAELFHGSSVMYAPGKILKSGGVEALTANHEYNCTDATDSAEIIDVGNLGIDPIWTYTGDMNHGRIDHNLVILPNGKVMALAGGKRHGGEYRDNPLYWVNSAEIWDPATGQWTLLPMGVAPNGPDPNTYRGYHSTAILLEDGRVVLGGADGKFPDENESSEQPPSAQIYNPNYGTGTRPIIVSGPDQMVIGSTSWANVTVGQNDAGVNSACLIAPGAVTHSFDMNQRRIVLKVTGSGTTKQVFSPSTTTQAPLGWYMLFMLKPDAQGNLMPSQRAKWVKVVLPPDN